MSAMAFKVIPKDMFFDRAAVMSAKGRAERRAMSKFGAFVRTDSRRSIRYRRPVPKDAMLRANQVRYSRPGRPPFSREKSGPMKKIFFAYEAREGSVVIGPLGFAKSPVPALHEYGGRDRRGASFPARPYMRPAFDRTKEKLPQIWRDAIK